MIGRCSDTQKLALGNRHSYDSIFPRMQPSLVLVSFSSHPGPPVHHPTPTRPTPAYPSLGAGKALRASAAVTTTVVAPGTPFISIHLPSINPPSYGIPLPFQPQGIYPPSLLLDEYTPRSSHPPPFFWYANPRRRICLPSLPLYEYPSRPSTIPQQCCSPRQPSV